MDGHISLADSVRLLAGERDELRVERTQAIGGPQKFLAERDALKAEVERLKLKIEKWHSGCLETGCYQELLAELERMRPVVEAMKRLNKWAAPVDLTPLSSDYRTFWNDFADACAAILKLEQK